MAKTNSDTNITTNTRGFIEKSDPLDTGVPMRPVPDGWIHTGPEDALEPNTRGDYRDRLGDTQHFTGKATRRSRYDLEPTIESVRQGPLDDDGGPLDAADPDYEAKLRRRQRRG